MWPSCLPREVFQAHLTMSSVSHKYKYLYKYQLLAEDANRANRNYRSTSMLRDTAFRIFKDLAVELLQILRHLFFYVFSWLHMWVIDSVGFVVPLHTYTKVWRHREAPKPHTSVPTQSLIWGTQKERDDGVVRFLWICIFVVWKLIIVTASPSNTRTLTQTR